MFSFLLKVFSFTKEKNLWLSPVNIPVANIVLIIHNREQQPLPGAMCNPILGSKLIHTHLIFFMHRIQNPFGMVLSRLNPSVIHSKISPEFQSSFHYIPPIPHVP